MAMICVLGASSDGRSPRYTEAASLLGCALAERDATVVYGGTVTGLMYHAAAVARERAGHRRHSPGSSLPAIGLTQVPSLMPAKVIT
jgi:predicted Rossmann-fold nucleotide-binding protein